MNIDNLYSDRYHIIYPDIHAYGWQTGWQMFNQWGTPSVDLNPSTLSVETQKNNALPYDLSGIWPDSRDYRQKSPGIMERAADLNKRCYKSDIDKAFWLN